MYALSLSLLVLALSISPKTHRHRIHVSPTVRGINVPARRLVVLRTFNEFIRARITRKFGQHASIYLFWIYIHPVLFKSRVFNLNIRVTSDELGPDFEVKRRRRRRRSKGAVEGAFEKDCTERRIYLQLIYLLTVNMP